MNNQLTKRQHYVPRTYLRGWSENKWNDGASDDDTVRAHLKINDTYEDCSPKSIMKDDWFYEKNPDAPDNKIEKIFGEYENKWSPTMKNVDTLLKNAVDIHKEFPEYKKSGESSNNYLMRTLDGFLDYKPEIAEIIKVFAAISYFRTPAALAAKSSELMRDPNAKKYISSVDINAYWLSEEAFRSTLVERFKGMNLKFLFSTGKSFITCDCPCFDVDTKNQGFKPLFGYDVGRSDSVVACFPLSSKLVVLLVPAQVTLKGQITQTPKYDAVFLAALGVEMFNAGVLQTAQKVVVSTKEYQKLTDIDPNWIK